MQCLVRRKRAVHQPAWERRLLAHFSRRRERLKPLRARDLAELREMRES